MKTMYRLGGAMVALLAAPLAVVGPARPVQAEAV